MRNLWVVLRFEIASFIKNKSFMISTLIICGLLIVGLSFPTFRDTFFSGSEETEYEQGQEDRVEEESFGFMDRSKEEVDFEILKTSFWRGELLLFESVEELKSAVRDREVEGGFIIHSPTEYEHVMRNNELISMDHSAFQHAMERAYRIDAFQELEMSYLEVEEILYQPILREPTILGTDSASNYMYTYILIFGLYFVIIVYGQVVATNVASEKSNRAMEVLVTSTKTEYLIFGKVLGGAIAGAGQIALVILLAKGIYEINRGAWDNQLDFVFDIPLSTLGSFAAFGILGYLFYLFIFGALGALVSRTEDVSTSVTPITIIFIAVFFVAVTGMQNTEGMLLKVSSFIPFSSFMAMFVRVSMGSVESWEVGVSLLILLITTLLTGWLASKIYRMGTLMYGNPVKITQVFKLLFQKS